MLANSPAATPTVVQISQSAAALPMLPSQRAMGKRPVVAPPSDAPSERRMSGSASAKYLTMGSFASSDNESFLAAEGTGGMRSPAKHIQPGPDNV